MSAGSRVRNRKEKNAFGFGLDFSDGRCGRSRRACQLRFFVVRSRGRGGAFFFFFFLKKNNPKKTCSVFELVRGGFAAPFFLEFFRDGLGENFATEMRTQRRRRSRSRSSVTAIKIVDFRRGRETTP